jgi:DNA sulfur modification protein DndB
MSKTNWEKMVSEKTLNSVKSSRKKQFDTLKIKADDLLQYVDAGWEKFKEYKNPKFVGIMKEKDIQEQFENRIWMLFASMGFSTMNADREFYMSYDFNDESLVHQVDILAVDDETIIFVECRATDEMTDQSFATDIKEFSNRISGLRREALKKYPNRKLKFIWATHNYIIQKKDLIALDKEGISYFNDSAVEYYSDLSKHLGSCSRYQLLGSLFANQEIKNMDNRIPAIQGKMGGYTYYSFSIEPEKLLKVGYVLHRNEANQNMMPTYQRIIKKARLTSVRNFINEGGYFPNSIIISIDTGGKGLVFDQSATKVEGSISKLGILHIPKKYRTAYIIDGQHRLYGYSDSKYASTNTVPVVAFVDLDRTEQIKLFMDINENQKAVPKSLRVTLNADMLWESKDLNERRQALRSKIAQMLGEEPTSPLRSRVIVGEAEPAPGRCITIEAIQAALKKCNFFNVYNKKNELLSQGTFDLDDNQESCDLFYPFIERCFKYIRENCLEEWNKGDKEDGMLTINRGIHGVIRVIDDLVNMLVGKEVINPKSQDTEDIFELISYYLKPLTSYINGLDAEQRKEIKKVFGGGGDVRFWRAYQKAIADARPDFRPDGLDEYWLNEAKTYNETTRNMIGEIENKIKTIISENLMEYYGDAWLVKGLPRNIYTKAKKLADDKTYELLSNNDAADDVEIWDYVSLSDCQAIVLNGKNWSTFFEDFMVRPEEAKIVGGKEAKTQWIIRLSAIKNKLSKESYSVPVDEYSYIKSIHDWIMGMLTL